MKRIGILTFHRSINAGAVMQSYALSTRLKALYPQHSVEIIDYHMNIVAEHYRYSVWKYLRGKSLINTLKGVAKLMLDPKMISRQNERRRIFEQCINTLPLSKRSILSNDTKELTEYINQNYDILVVGSDAVWNYVLRGFPNAYMPGPEILCPKLSYAASCYGMDFTHEEANKQALRNIFDSFEFIGVRDQATENFVRWTNSKASPVHTCDPTAFLDVNSLPIDPDTLHQKMQARGFDFSRPTICMMGTDKMCAMIRQMYGKQYQIVALYEYVANADVNLYDLTPFEWAYVFRYARLTITTYFHGTMLSLRNGVPVICIALATEFAKKHTPKTLDVLGRLGYEDWYFQTDYKGTNFDAIKQKAEELLSVDLKSEILERINREAQSFTAFHEAIEKRAKD